MKPHHFLHVLLPSLLLPVPAGATRIDCDKNTPSSTLPVTVTVNIPAFLFLQVGNSQQTPELTYDLSQGLTSGAYSGPLPPAGHSNLQPSSITGSDLSNGLNVTVRANCGQVKIAYHVSDNNGLSNGQGQYIPYDALQASSSDSNLPSPTLRNAADAESFIGISSYGSVTNRSAAWRYAYSNAATPAAGVYQGTVTYRASCL
ncbi:MAG: hypothetical protein HZT40_15670 [Candidatus Thiothrix singaporensis]|uniref:Spore coat protein U domain-containing protein n=1 Tax=Candidatus Thiothrix singaporensis TaxID=2799669 RepID=A0A7L6AUM4_9GAMM|nr:MAG: hypothetical protein HZT40_15670 [Candidatus Thiothrix singaporensis]